MRIRQFTKSYSVAEDGLAWASLLPTLCFYTLSLLAAIMFRDSWILLALFVFLAAIGIIRIYMLQHDCGHNSFFEDRDMNTRVGTLLSIITCTPLKSLRYNHGLHHAHIGDLDERDASEIYTMTLKEYAQAPLWLRIGYRIYRSPLTLFVIGPSLIFLVRYRWPKNIMKTGISDAMITNLMLAVKISLLVAVFGMPAFYIWLCAAVIASSIGAFIPYIQHNFENAYWDRNPDLDFETAALQGTTILSFGPLFDLCTANIAYHDIHHLNARVPSYKLKQCHQDMVHLLSPTRVGFLEGVGSIQWKLWDEEQSKMVHFPKRQEMVLASQDTELA